MKAHCLQDMQRKARSKYREHYVLVKRIAPPERYLEFKFEDGWKPLCDFLQKPIPDVPLPHVNEAAALKEKINAIVLQGIKNALLTTSSLLYASIFITLVALVWYSN